MRFKLKDININVRFTFLFLVLIFILSGKTKFLCNILLCSLIHECVHLLFLIMFKGVIKRIDLTICGGNIVRGDCLSYSKEVIVNLSAPVANIALGIIFIILYGKSSVFGCVSLLTGFFNILPFYCFDGGNGLYYLLRMYLTETKAKSIVFCLSVIIVSVFSLISILLILLNQSNIYLILLSAYLCFSLILTQKSEFCGL